MRPLLLAPIVALNVLLAVSASRADVGPAPKCPPGTYSAYLYGRHCVPEGSHLEKDASGNVQIVPDASPKGPAAPTTRPVSPPQEPPAPPAPVATPAPTQFAAPPPSTSASATTPVATGAPSSAPEASPSSVVPPPVQRGCSCEVPSAPRTGAYAALAALSALLGAALLRQTERRRGR